MGADLRAATILVRVNTPRISRRHVKVRSFLYHRWILDKSERLVRTDEQTGSPVPPDGSPHWSFSLIRRPEDGASGEAPIRSRVGCLQSRAELPRRRNLPLT